MASDRRLPWSRALYDVQAGQQAVAHDDIEHDDQPSSPSMTREAHFVITQRVVQHLTAIAHPTDPSRHVLLVRVPPSHEAPHMVDQRYWGRSAVGKRALTDAEASRLWSVRRAANDTFERLLASRPAELDTLWPTSRQVGWAHMVLEPATGLGSQRVQDDPLRPLQATLGGVSFNSAWSPSFENLDFRLPHPDGNAWASFQSGNNEAFIDRYGLLLLITDGGSIRIIGPSTQLFGREEKELCISANHLLELLHQAITFASRVSRT
jgi:hypothetical protein